MATRIFECLGKALVMAFLLTATPCVAAGSAEAKEVSTKVNEAAAANLVAEALNYPNTDYLDCEGKEDAPFYTCAVLGKVSIAGYYSVNPWTGRVWSVWDCKWVSTPRLRASMAAVKDKYSHHELGRYARLNRLHPLCEFP